ncbi:hypothetical protein FIC87_03575 [Eggerthella lenta]|uniref:DMSO reductase n=2 Tax=Eggerthella lenta TaxID=84112 RepID=A0A5C5C599_EGGLN|nr:hypothetical protein FIC87_03575 [Eggerthella lenta]
MTMISEFPLFLFTTLGGLAAGAYVAAAIFPDVDRKPKRPWLFPLVCLALLGVGLLGVLGHLGRPERFLLAMSNPSSMIAEEAYWSIAFGALMLVDFVLLLRRGASPRAVRVVAAVAAGALMCIMGWAYFTSYGNPAWAAWQTLPLFVLGDLAMGSALWALMREGAYRSDAFAAAFGLLAWKGRLPGAVAPVLAFVCAFAGVAVARYAFYAASVL